MYNFEIDMNHTTNQSEVKQVAVTGLYMLDLMCFYFMR